MFRRRATPNAAASVPMSTHIEAALVANPDTPAINRERALRYATGRLMQGNAGMVVDYDRGDPEHSFNRVIAHTTSPAVAYGRIGRSGPAAAYNPNPEIYDLGTTDATLTAYQVNMLARITR